jgi:hypothetical protein
LSAITYLDDVPPDALGVRHPACGEMWKVADLDADDPAAPLRDGKLCCPNCLDGAGGGYGFVPVYRLAVGDLLPPSIASSYAPVPNALWDFGANLGLKANDRLVICAIWRHQALGRAFPPLDMLAHETDLSESTVKRTVARLKRRDLLAVWDRGRSSAGRRLSNEYDLSPLWEALAAAAREAGGHGDLLARGHGDLAQGVTVTSQREEGEGDEGEVEPPDGGSLAARDHATASDGEQASSPPGDGLSAYERLYMQVNGGLPLRDDAVTLPEASVIEEGADGLDAARERLMRMLPPLGRKEAA